MNKFPRSAYVHIPFCHRRCFYCDFAVIPLGNKVEPLQGYGSKTVKEYLHFLYKEILSIKHKSPLSTIYIGGGTPSILDPTQIKELIDLFKENYGIDYGAEVTMEVDPASFTQDDLLILLITLDLFCLSTFFHYCLSQLVFVIHQLHFGQ